MDKAVRLLDLFCGAGGAAMGYYRAGFTDITGIDNRPMPRYPFEFIQADALEYLAEHGQEYDVIHASPPCQGYSRMRHLNWLKNINYPLLIDNTRKLLQQTKAVWVIENVSDSPLMGAELCGLALGLPLLRHRRFESNILLLFPPCPKHPVIYHGNKNLDKNRPGGIMGILNNHTIYEAMGINWMNQKEMRQAIPPAYTEFIGKQLLDNLK